MSERQLESWIDGFLDYTDNTEPRESFRRWVGISTVASAMQRKCRLRWGRETFFPNLYIILVGPPASRKGTAMREGISFLKRIGMDFAADESSRQKLITSLKESVSSNTMLSGEAQFHCSLNVYASELTVFLGYEDRDFLSMLCKWFDCEDRFVYDTHGRGREEIANVWVNLLGGTTPMQLQSSLPDGAVGSGFTSRVIFVYEEDKEKTVIKPELTHDQLAIEDALSIDLSEIHTMSGDFVVTPQFEKLYEKWRYASEAQRVFHEPRLDYYIQRRPTHLFKLAMVYSASRASDRIITADDLQLAIDTITETEVKMPQVFTGVGANPLAGLQTRMLKTIRDRETVSVKDLARIFSNDASYTQLSEAMSSLSQMGHILFDMKKGVVTHAKN
jgi:hypothetical protein